MPFKKPESSAAHIKILKFVFDWSPPLRGSVVVVVCVDASDGNGYEKGTFKLSLVENYCSQIYLSVVFVVTLLRGDLV